MSLAISLFGSPEIRRDGKLVSLDTRKALALLAYLVVSGRPQRREHLADLLWPDSDGPSGRAALRRTLSSLHKALPEGTLSADREVIGLHLVDSSAIDVTTFAHLASSPNRHQHQDHLCPDCLDALARAAGLYTADFLAGFTLRDSPDFDDWQSVQAETFRRQLATALRRLTAALVDGGEFEQAIAYARRWVNLDPLQEQAHQHLMVAYALSGNRNAALLQYEECVRVLDRELAVAPLGETTSLWQSIRDGSFAPHGPAEHLARRFPPRSGLDMPQLLPFVGREEEWDRLHAAYDTAGRQGLLVILEGEAGVGKTRLIDELCADLADHTSVLRVRCYQGDAAIAYAPFVELLTQAASTLRARREWESLPEPVRREASRLLPREGEAVVAERHPVDTAAEETRFRQAIRDVLAAAMEGTRPGLLVIDDAQWLDEASLGLLAFLCRRLSAWHVCLLVAFRQEDVPEGAPLRLILHEAAREAPVEQLRLNRLDEEAVSALLDATPGAASDQSIGPRLYQETEGLPLFVAEYLRNLSARDQPEKSLDLPRTVRDVLKDRLLTLSELGTQVVQAGSVVGRRFDFDLARQMCGRDEEGTVVGLEESIGRAVLREVGDGGAMPVYDFSHEKLRQVAYEMCSLARRRLLHRRAANALESRLRPGEEGPLAAAIAHHYAEGGNGSEAARFFALAGDYARSLFANRDALALYQNALAWQHPEPALIHEAIADLEVLLGEYPAALAHLRTALALGDTPSGRLEHKLGSVHDRRGDVDLASAHYRAALDLRRASPPSREHAALLADWSLNCRRRRDLAEAASGALECLAVAERLGDPASLARAHNTLGLLANEEAHEEEADQYFSRSLQFAEQAADEAAQAAALNNLSLLAANAGDWLRARNLAEAALELVRRQGDRHREAALYNNLADLTHRQGERGQAMEYLKKAVGVYAEIGVEAGEVQPEIWKLSEW